MKKILFFGDYIPARNYGSIATTEAMKNLVEGLGEENEVRYIDSRYYRKQAPENGFPPYTISFKEKSFKKKLADYAPVVRKLWRGVKQKDDSKIHVPYKFSMYEDYYAQMEKGEILPYEMKMIGWADVVIFQGEGLLVHGIDKYGKYVLPGLYQLFMLWVVKTKFGKPVSMVNHAVDPENTDAEEMIKHIYPLVDYVAVRERMSVKVLEKLGVTNGKFVPDALFAYKPEANWKPSAEISQQIDFSKPYIVLGDTSGILQQKYFSSVKWDIEEIYSEMVKRLQEVVPQVIFLDGFRGMNKGINNVIINNKLGFISLLNCSYQDLFHVFKGAELFISGRWHNSILASMANTPVILMGADSHKTKALYDILGYEGHFFDLAPLPIHMDELVEATRDTLARKQSIKKELTKNIGNLSLQAEENVAHLKAFLNNK